MDKFDILQTESRNGHDKFFWYISIFSGASLTLIFNFVVNNTDQIKIHNDLVMILLIKISIILFLSSLILAPIRNYLSYFITSYIGHYETYYKSNKKTAEEYYNKAKVLSSIRFIISILNLIFCFFALLFFTYSVIGIYLN